MANENVKKVFRRIRICNAVKELMYESERIRKEAEEHTEFWSNYRNEYIIKNGGIPINPDEIEKCRHCGKYNHYYSLICKWCKNIM